MKLAELDPQFLRREIRPCHEGAPGCNVVSPHTDHEWHVYVDAIAEADGIMFACPVCLQANGGPAGTHYVICWRPRVPADVAPKPGRWEFEGKGLDDLTLVAGSSSILLRGGCNAHFWIRNGEIVL